MWEERAYRARRDIAALAASGLGVSDLHAAAGLVRAGRDFSGREVEYFTEVAPAIAGATRLAVRSEILDRATAGRPAIVVLGPRGEVRSATPEARQWQERLDETAPGRFEVMMRIMARGVQSTASGASGPGSATGGDSGPSCRPARSLAERMVTR